MPATYWLGLATIPTILGTGYDRSQIEPLHAAIAAVIGPKLTRVAPGTRTPHDPGVVYAEED